MPYISLNNGNESNKKNKKSRKPRSFSVVFLAVILVFLMFQIFRMISTYNELQIRYSEQSKKLKAVNKIYDEKLRVLNNLKEKLSERGVGINGSSIYEMDIHNVAQTSQATGTKSTTPGK